MVNCLVSDLSQVCLTPLLKEGLSSCKLSKLLGGQWELTIRFKDVYDAHDFYADLKKTGIHCELAKVSCPFLDSKLTM
jgi:hypothetical protein